LQSFSLFLRNMRGGKNDRSAVIVQAQICREQAV